MKLLNLQLGLALVIALTTMVNAVPTSTLIEVTAPETSIRIDSALLPAPLASDNITMILPGVDLFGPTDLVASGVPLETHAAKELPAVPGAILMTLAGFLCVSLVRDRRAWLATVTTILNLAQTGVRIIPQLALCTAFQASRKSQPSAVRLTRDGTNRALLSNDPTGISYAGLLYRLAAIPGYSNLNTPIQRKNIQIKKGWQTLSAQALFCAHNSRELSEPDNRWVGQYLSPKPRTTFPGHRSVQGGSI
ncbi:MAG: hypothetical protein K9M57_06150 [Phycisphaerae bacterium]|nr:hypothetical protein [Phycisphaerae bacterium]